MRGRCVAACKDQAPKHPFRDSNPRPPAVQAIALSTELWPDFSFSPAFVHYRIAGRLVEGEESPRVSLARAPKTGWNWCILPETGAELLKAVLRKEETMSLKERLVEGHWSFRAAPKKPRVRVWRWPCKRSIFKYWNQLRFGALKLFF